MAFGYFKPIEQVQPHDRVLSRDQHGQTVAYQPIKEVYRRTSYQLRHLTFQNASGTSHQTQTLQTTDEHPFWNASIGTFTDAGKPKVGGRAAGPDGQLQALASTERTEYPEGVPVFNFRVAEYHTYYAAAPSGTPVLVHNADCARGHADGGVATAEQALVGAEQYLGPNYRDMGDGRYLSSDGMRQVRLGNHELKDPQNLHIHFEHYNVPWMQGGKVVESGFTAIR